MYYRKFLMEKIPPELSVQPQLFREKALVAREVRMESEREVSLLSFRKSFSEPGSSGFLVTEEHQGLFSEEQKVPLSSEAWEFLSEHSWVRWLESVDFLFGDSRVIRMYRGRIKGLILLIEGFSSLDEARSYELPFPVMAEVTFDPRYREGALASLSRGEIKKLLPKRLRKSSSVGVLPYRKKEGAAKVVMVTNKRGDYWIFPKGQREDDLTAREAALKEGLEEAGLSGKLRGHALLVPYEKEGRTTSVFLYPMKISKKKKKWNEEAKRDRASLKLPHARRVANSSMAKYALDYLKFRFPHSKKEEEVQEL